MWPSTLAVAKALAPDTVRVDLSNRYTDRERLSLTVTRAGRGHSSNAARKKDGKNAIEALG